MTKSDKPQDPERSVTLDDVEQPSEKRDTRTDSWRVRSEDEDGDRGPGEHADELVGQVVAGRYLIKGLLGRGGMGAVYRAEHTELQKQVALKVLHRYMSTNKEVVARFEREAVAAGRLTHPGIVAATDFGLIEDGSFYLALEFIDGRSLSDVLESEGALPPERAVSIAIQMSDALCTAHAAGIVHRDLKPDNVLLVSMREDDDFVKVVDFGIAKVSLDDDQQEGLTRAGLVFGTPEYMSPEQAMGHSADARSDLYGLGMILYEMLAGSSPFQADDVTAMLRAQIKDPPPPLPDEVPVRLRELVGWLLQKDPEDRPEDATALTDELTEIAGSLQFPLPPPRTSAGSRIERSRKPSSATGPSRPALNRGFSFRPVHVGNRSIPMWIPMAALGVGVAVGLTAMLLNEDIKHFQGADKKQANVDAEGQMILDAAGGDRDAIAELRKLTALKQAELEEAGAVSKEASGSKEVAGSKEASGSTEVAGSKEAAEKPADVERKKKAAPDAAEAISQQANRYLALGRGYSIIKHHTAAIEMYREAVGLDPHLSEDPELLVDVRLAIAARDAVEDGLDFARGALGAHGADIIYDVYLDHLGQAGMTPVVARAMKLAQSEELLEQATPPLKVALQLDRAKLCGEYRDIIPEAVKHADDRSLPKLRALSVQRGCGTQGINDCYICLRKDDVDLEGAIKRAETHASPSYLASEAPVPD